ncbi:MAG: dTMP kinase [Deltaproteobacteria bacterium]|nr:dTMP kinase [Deltaproteobacteria bacterium]MBW2417794.1 dTMP kinase [Deltaproteobacteria bacterium]
MAFEGLDGCGKSTQLELLAEVLREAGFDVLATREPTDGAMGQRIRAMARSGEVIPAEEELRWFVEDRREHVRDTIEPALAAGRMVLTDRYTLSSVAYQGARGLDPEEILRAGEAEFPLPDLALLFELDADAGLARVKARGGVAEPSFEQSAFLQKAEKIFESLERAYIERIDASPAPEQVRERVLAVLHERLALL